MKRLDAEFYEKYDTIMLAQQLIGCELVHESTEGTTAGIIVETEAYLQNDPASHSFKGKTSRNEPMFGRAGSIYVYLIYGVYECFNVVSNATGVGEAVLIRAIEPTIGIELMQESRNTKNLKKLCSGPGKLVQAMGISRKNNFDFLNEKIYINARQFADYQIVSSHRIGITKGAELPFRFCLSGSNFLSK